MSTKEIVEEFNHWKHVFDRAKWDLVKAQTAHDQDVLDEIAAQDDYDQEVKKVVAQGGGREALEEKRRALADAVRKAKESLAKVNALKAKKDGAKLKMDALRKLLSAALSLGGGGGGAFGGFGFGGIGAIGAGGMFDGGGFSGFDGAGNPFATDSIRGGSRSVSGGLGGGGSRLSGSGSSLLGGNGSSLNRSDVDFGGDAPNGTWGSSGTPNGGGFVIPADDPVPSGEPAPEPEADSEPAKEEKKKEEEKNEDPAPDDPDNTKRKTGSGHMPNPMGGGSPRFTGVAFFDDLMMRALRVQGSMFSARTGPIQALRPDTDGGGPGVTSVAIQQGVLDPVTLVAGGQNYDGRTYGNRRSGGYIDLSGRGIEALRPDDGGEEGSGNTTVALVQKLMGDRGRGPRDPEGGSPEAFGVSVVAVSAGVADGTVSK